MSNMTTLSIEKSIFAGAAKQAKSDYVSVSSVARMLLNEYAKGKIKIMAVQIDNPVELRQLSEGEITPEIRKSIHEAKKIPKSKLANL